MRGKIWVIAAIIIGLIASAAAATYVPIITNPYYDRIHADPAPAIWPRPPEHQPIPPEHQPPIRFFDVDYSYYIIYTLQCNKTFCGKNIMRITINPPCWCEIPEIRRCVMCIVEYRDHGFIRQKVLELRAIYQTFDVELPPSAKDINCRCIGMQWRM